MIDSIGKPGIIPPGVVWSTTVNAWPPLLVTVIVCVVETPFLLIATEYVPGGRVKVTVPCTSVTPCSGAGTQGVKAVGVTTTVAPDTGFPCVSTTLIVTVTFDPQTGVVVVDTVVVLPVVNVETVETTVDVKVVENVPPKGENLNTVERGVL
jgi:hypothetical protein